MAIQAQSGAAIPKKVPVPRALDGLALPLNRLDAAKATYRQAVERKRDNPFLHVDLYGVAFLEGDAAEMGRQVSLAAGNPEAEDWLLSLESGTNPFFGHVGKAREFSWRAVEWARHGGQKETAALARLGLARALALQGESSQVPRRLSGFLRTVERR